MDEWGTRTLFRDLVANEPPTSTIDVTKAISAGRRIRRRRTGFGVAGVAVLVAGAIAAAVLPTLRDAPAPVATVAQTAPAQFDPARLILRVGWRPAHATVVSTSTNRDHQLITFVSASRRAGGSSTFGLLATVRINSRGVLDRTFVRTTPSVAGPDINGAPSRWYPSASGPDVLLWHWATGGEATVSVSAGSSPLREATRLARSVRTDRSTAVTMPFSVTLPSGPRLVGTIVTLATSGDYYAEAQLGNPTSTAGSRPGETRSFGRLYASDGDLGISTATPNTTIAGRPVWVNSPTAASSVQLHRTDTTVVGLLNANAVLTRGGDAIALVFAVQLVDNPRRRGNWTTKYLR